MIKFKTHCNGKAHTVEIGQVTLYFSYETCIAVHTGNQGLRLANSWGVTTGRHFNVLGCKDFTIVSDEDFVKFEKVAFLNVGHNLI
jgi:hypothetical protein